MILSLPIKAAIRPLIRKGGTGPLNAKILNITAVYTKPIGWGAACRFVVMRIPKEKAKKPGQAIQCVLFEDDRYLYRIFCTNLGGKPHKIITEYDKRADVENLVGEAKREGLGCNSFGQI